jgi:hypothetical protein
MRKITMLNGKTVEVECLSCALTSGKIKPDGGVIVDEIFSCTPRRCVSH